MCGLSTERFNAAVAAIDQANAADQRDRLVAEPELLLAARAHHLRRWALPRTQYEPGKAGYLRWKRDQRQRHGRDVGELLATVGFDASAIERVQQLVRRDHLATDPGAQAVEDAACLVFIETQLAAIAAQLDHDHLVDVIRKTAKKMSSAALARVSEIPLGTAERQLLATALALP